MYRSFTFERARNCLSFLVEYFDIKEMHIPYYLCDVVRHTLFEKGCKPLFYHINDDFMPECDFPYEDYILYPNYFGVCRSNAEVLSNKYPKLIVDNAHAFYEKPSGFGCFNSGQKFDNKEKSWLWISENKIKFNEGDIYCTSDDLPYNNPLKIEKIYHRFKEFHSKYGCDNQLNIELENVLAPFCYPFLAKTIQKSDKLAEELCEQGLIIYRYWNPLPKNYNEYKFYSRLVPIPLNF